MTSASLTVRLAICLAALLFGGPASGAGETMLGIGLSLGQEVRDAPPLRGQLRDEGIWRAYKTRFVSETGRVIDTANGGISHSEGQGYGMLLAVAANDRDGFDRIWSWTRANLMVRDDSLFAWRWEPAKRPAVADMNNATDGDMLIAWALIEAAESWDDRAYAVAARRTAVDVGRKLVLSGTPHGFLLLPAMAGFTADARPDGPVVNLSYLVFPALLRLSKAAPEIDWIRLAEDGLALIERARFGQQRLAVEWTALGRPEPAPAAGFEPVSGYNAIRIPLYLAWAGLDRGLRAAAAPGAVTLAVTDVMSNRMTGSSGELGYGAMPALLACQTAGTAWPAALVRPRMSDSYYSVTLHMMALVAAQMRYPSCVRG